VEAPSHSDPHAHQRPSDTNLRLSSVFLSPCSRSTRSVVINTQHRTQTLRTRGPPSERLLHDLCLTKRVGRSGCSYAWYFLPPAASPRSLDQGRHCRWSSKSPMQSQRFGSLQTFSWDRYGSERCSLWISTTKTTTVRSPGNRGD